MRTNGLVAVFFLFLVACAGIPSIGCADTGDIDALLGMGGRDNISPFDDQCEAGDIVAANAGTIVLVKATTGDDQGMGNSVIIEHTLTDQTKVYSLYSHLASIELTAIEGAIVARGDKIGTMGASGFGAPCYWENQRVGIHLHFEIKDKPVLRNPSGPKRHWLYTPSNPDNFGYHDPNAYVGFVSALDPNNPSDVKGQLFRHPSRTPQQPGCLYASNVCNNNSSFHAGANYGSVDDVSFDDNFSSKSSLLNWSQDSGSWFISKKGYFFTEADPTLYNSYGSTYNSVFTNFDFSVRMLRSNECNTCANRIIVGASGKIITGSFGVFPTAYHFQYDNKGFFSIFRRIDGSEGAIVNWTKTEALRKGARWNVLRVIVKDSAISFLINDRVVWEGTDPYLLPGFVGFGMFSDTTSKLSVDWAKLVPK